MYNLITLLLLLLPISSFSSVQQCFEKKFSNIECNFKDNSNLSMSHTQGDYANHKRDSSKQSLKGLAKRQSLINRMTSKINEEKLNSCQVATLIKCVSTSLDYVKHDPLDYSRSLGEIYLDNDGICGDFATIFNDLASEFKLKTQVIRGNLKESWHAFNIIKLDTKWYILEPQRADATYYRIESGVDIYDYINKKLIIFSSESDEEYFRKECPRCLIFNI